LFVAPAPRKRTKPGRPGRARAVTRRSQLALAACLIAVALFAHAPAALAVGVNETKSEMLWNIAKFVQWPDAALANSKGQIVFTILGEDDLAAELANLLSSKTINGKPVFVRFARRAQDARGSQILYVAASETEHLDAVLLEVSGSPVLTVADTPAFAAHGGMVGFASDSGKVRFEINLGHAERSGLRISAKLLALARVVDSGN
jgi:hypothetical protein